MTFDEFLSIPPCTTGTHSAVDDTPAALATPAPKPTGAPQPIASAHGATPAPRIAVSVPQAAQEKAEPEPESEDDDPALEITAGATCRRRRCGATAGTGTGSSREGESCLYHPGRPIFHEGSKGWTCCKKRVLEFDEFMGLEGCARKEKHMFVGSGRKAKASAADGGLERVDTVRWVCWVGFKRLISDRFGNRHDFYQTSTTVQASLYLKKISKPDASVVFASPMSIELDLPTTDKKRYKTTIPLYGAIDPERSTFKIMGTKLDLTLVKADGLSWPVLRADERHTGEIIQTGKAGVA